MSSGAVANKLLLLLSDADRALFQSQLEPVELELRKPIECANTTIEHVYFPDTGIISVVAKSGKDQIEVAVVGREGMSGTTIVMGNHRSPNDAYVQLAGSAHRLDAQVLRNAVEASASLRQMLQRYAQVFVVQVAQTALANGRAKIEERLARWLLMAHDRLDNDDLSLTHEFISVMLGVRRPGVTDALHELEGKGLVRSVRGSIRIIDRDGLIMVAGSAYGVPEAEYQRLLG